jgi:hypothetical protein
MYFCAVPIAMIIAFTNPYYRLAIDRMYAESNRAKGIAVDINKRLKLTISCTKQIIELEEKRLDRLVREGANPKSDAIETLRMHIDDMRAAISTLEHGRK